MPRIVVDAMGGDLGPRAGVQAALEAVSQDGLDVILVGDQDVIVAQARLLGYEALPFEVVHAGSVIVDGEAPVAAVRAKRDASVRVAYDLVAAGRGDAVVTAGHTGAALVSAVLHLDRLPGVERPALLASLPARGGEVALLDVGANAEASPRQLVGFAALGYAFARASRPEIEPRIGLVCNGTEPGKGTALLRETDALLRELDFGYVGFVEGHALFGDVVDVAVCDGLLGNVLLKAAEGAIEHTLALVAGHAGGSSEVEAALAQVEEVVSYERRGGALMVGLEAVSVVAHGRSGPRALRRAMRQAATWVEAGIVPRMRAAAGAAGLATRRRGA